MPPIAGCKQNAGSANPALDGPASNRYAAIFQLFADVLLDFLPDLAAPGLAKRMRQYARIDGLQGVYFDHSSAVYVLDPVRVWSPSLRAPRGWSV